MNIELSTNERHKAAYSPAFLKQVYAKRKRQRTKKQSLAAKNRIDKRQDAERYINRKREECEAVTAAKRIEAQRRADAAIGQYRMIEILKPNGEEVKQKRQTILSIILEVSAETGISPDEIKGPKRAKAIVRARHDAVYRTLTRRPDLSLPQIGKAFNRDHTTIMHVRDKYNVDRPNAYHKRKAA